MSSGNHGQKVGFNTSGAPLGVPACESAAAEPRGPKVYFSGLCVICGRAVVRRDGAGVPRHLPGRVAAAAAGGRQ
jgi:hypothetical protein